jgi:hypothetical protein
MCLGSGAFSYVDGTLYATTFSLNAYVERIGRGLTGVISERRLGVRQRMRYELLVRLFSLRLEREWVRARYGPRFERTLGLELLGLKLLGAVTEDEHGWSLTQPGMFPWVRMMSAFFESVDAFREQMRHKHSRRTGKCNRRRVCGANRRDSTWSRRNQARALTETLVTYAVDRSDDRSRGRWRLLQSFVSLASYHWEWRP